MSASRPMDAGPACLREAGASLPPSAAAAGPPLLRRTGRRRQGGGRRGLLSRLIGAAAAVAVALAVAAPLSSCGKKGDIKPPPGKTSDFPRTYPRE